MQLLRNFFAWIRRDWHFSRLMLLFFLCMCFAHEPTVEGIMTASLVHQAVMSTVFGFALTIDSIQYQYTNRRLLHFRE